MFYETKKLKNCAIHAMEIINGKTKVSELDSYHLILLLYNLARTVALYCLGVMV